MTNGASTHMIEGGLSAKIDQSLANVARFKGFGCEFLVLLVKDLIKDGDRFQLEEVVPRIELD